jgi:hypothetical protein
VRAGPGNRLSRRNECPLRGWLLASRGTTCRQPEYGSPSFTEDPISITSAGSNPIAWQAGQAQLPPRRHAEKPPEPAATGLGAAGEDLAAERTQQRVWAEKSAVGQSTPWDAGRDAPANGQLVDAYA